MNTEQIEITTVYGKIFLQIYLFVGILFLAGCIIGSTASFISGGVQDGFWLFAILIFALFLYLFTVLFRLFIDARVIKTSNNGFVLTNTTINYENVREIKIYYGLFKMVIIKFVEENGMNRIVGMLPIISNRKYKNATKELKRIKANIK